MYCIAGMSPTVLACGSFAVRNRRDSFSITLTGIPSGSVQHRLSAVHEHNG